MVTKILSRNDTPVAACVPKSNKHSCLFVWVNTIQYNASGQLELELRYFPKKIARSSLNT